MSQLNPRNPYANKIVMLRVRGLDGWMWNHRIEWLGPRGEVLAETVGVDRLHGIAPDSRERFPGIPDDTNISSWGEGHDGTVYFTLVYGGGRSPHTLPFERVEDA